MLDGTGGIGRSATRMQITASTASASSMLTTRIGTPPIVISPISHSSPILLRMSSFCRLQLRAQGKLVSPLLIVSELLA
jgi:hypothetical protein